LLRHWLLRWERSGSWLRLILRSLLILLLRYRLITALHRLRLILRSSLMHTYTIYLPCRKIVEPLARVLRPLVSIRIEMNSNLLTWSKSQLLNLCILNVEYKTLWILTTLVLDYITCATPLVATL
jgi:hypothetical protein